MAQNKTLISEYLLQIKNMDYYFSSPYIAGKLYGRIDQSFVLTAPTLVSEGKELEIKGKTHLALIHHKPPSVQEFLHNCMSVNQPACPILQKLFVVFSGAVYLHRW